MGPIDIIRAAVAECEAQGIGVQYVDGWERRGRPNQPFAPRGLVCHHTATQRYEQDYPSLGVVLNGVVGLAGPLCQFGIGRHTGDVIVVAAGTANHAGPGGWNGLAGNATVWGIEAENDGEGEPWSEPTTRTYLALAVALARHTPFHSDMIAMHREWNPVDKKDPTGIDGDWFRSEVARILAGGPGPSLADPWADVFAAILGN